MKLKVRCADGLMDGRRSAGSLCALFLGALHSVVHRMTVGGRCDQRSERE
ncbi:MAG: hypothetical protein R2811_07310 [Flavobacteriales bacterium]